MIIGLRTVLFFVQLQQYRRYTIRNQIYFIRPDAFYIMYYIQAFDTFIPHFKYNTLIGNINIARICIQCAHN